jgi:hypothetical protein
LLGNVSNEEVDKVAKDWFRYAKDREGGRKEREQRKMREAAADNFDD